MLTNTIQLCARWSRKKISATSRAAPVAAASALPSPSALPVPPVPLLTAAERYMGIHRKNSSPLRRLAAGGAANQYRRRRDPAGCGWRACCVRRVDRAGAAFAPARTHRATSRSASRGRGRMGTHGRRRKVQRAEAEVCAQGKGALACLLRWPMSGCDGRLGRHQYGRVRPVEQRGERELRPGRGSRRGSVSAVGSRSARSVHRWRGKRPRAIMYDIKALFPVRLRSDYPPC